MAYPPCVGETGGLPAAPKLPLVERQKVGLRTCQLGRHVDQFRVDGEVCQAPSIGEERLPRVSVPSGTGESRAAPSDR